MSITFEGRISGSPGGTETVSPTFQLAALKPLFRKLPFWDSRLKVELSDSFGRVRAGRKGQRRARGAVNCPRRKA